MRTSRYLITILCLVFSASSGGFKLPDSFVAEYRLEKYNTTVAEMSLQLSRQNQYYIYQSVTHPYGLTALFSNDKVTETSRLIQSKKANYPLLSLYEFKRIKKTKRNQTIDLYWSQPGKVEIKGNYGNNKFNLQHQGALWDRLSVQLALAEDIRRTTDMPAGHKFSYSVVDRGQIKQYQFSYLLTEPLSLGKNTYNTVKLKRTHSSGKKVTLMWLAQELDFIPVKMEQFKKGKLHAGMELSKFKRQLP